MARRFQSFGESSSSSSSSSSLSSSRQIMDDNVVCVAVGKEIEESKHTLIWALNNFSGRVCVLHVHQPSVTPPLKFARFAENSWAIQESERSKMDKLLNGYLQICNQAEVPAEPLCIEMDDVAEGIIKLVDRHKIKKLVIGAGANELHTGRTTQLKSTKAMHVLQHVPSFCRVWFICNGRPILEKDAFDLEDTSESSVIETGQSNLRSPVQGSGHLASSSGGVVGDSTLMAFDGIQEENSGQLIDQLSQAILDVEKSKREAFEESMKRVKAEKSAIDAIRRARELENAYKEELRQRREIAEELAKQKEDIRGTKNQWNEERLTAMDQRLLLENEVANYELLVKELNDKILSHEATLEIYEREQDNLRIERDNAVQTSEELSRRQYSSEFSVSEIYESTNSFDPSRKIGEGGYGSIYKGSLRHTQVAIKVLRTTSLQGPSQFEQEVDLLSKLRHPNLATFIGVCPDICALVYEYFPNGSLEDRLNCMDDPLSWQTRTRIAIDICSVLLFLHSSNPCVIHGNLKPGNILLDAKVACKLIDFGMFRAHSLRENSIHSIDPEGTFPYLDPEFLRTGELSPKSDIYSFGIILLQLLSGRSPLNIASEVQNAYDRGDLHAILDPLAGNWPFEETRQLTYWALRCCDDQRSRRPSLDLEVWNTLGRMRDQCGSTSSFQMASEEYSEPPSYFICPITHDVMEYPHVAADGYTYELEDIRAWMCGPGNDPSRWRSPMTNHPHENFDLLPNHSLRSAIREWRPQRP